MAGALGKSISRSVYHINGTANGALAKIGVSYPVSGNRGGVWLANSLLIQNTGGDLLRVSFDGTNYYTIQVNANLSIDADLDTVWVGTPGGNAAYQIVATADVFCQ